MIKRSNRSMIRFQVRIQPFQLLLGAMTTRYEQTKQINFHTKIYKELLSLTLLFKVIGYNSVPCRPFECVVRTRLDLRIVCFASLHFWQTNVSGTFDRRILAHER